MPRGLWVVVCGLLVGLSLSTPLIASEGNPTWDTFDVAIEVEATGDLIVTETQRFAPKAQAAQKLTRRLALDRIDAITDVQLYEDGHELSVSTRVKSDHVRLRWRQPRRSASPHTVVLRYRVKGGVYVHAEGDQIVWPALAAEREGTIQQGTVSIRVPGETGARIQQFMSYGVGAEARQVDDHTVTFETQRAVQSGEGLDVKVVLPHGALGVEQSGWQQGKERPYALPGVLGYIDTAAFIIMGVLMIGGALYVAAERSQGYTATIHPGVNGQIQVVDQRWPSGETGHYTGESR